MHARREEHATSYGFTNAKFAVLRSLLYLNIPDIQTGISQ